MGTGGKTPFRGVGCPNEHNDRFGKRRGVNRVENGFDWRNGQVVKERVSTLEAIRLARGEIVLGSAWTSRFVRDHKAVGTGRFRLGDRGDFLSR